LICPLQRFLRCQSQSRQQLSHRHHTSRMRNFRSISSATSDRVHNPKSLVSRKRRAGRHGRRCARRAWRRIHRSKAPQSAFNHSARPVGSQTIAGGPGAECAPPSEAAASPPSAEACPRFQAEGLRACAAQRPCFWRGRAAPPTGARRRDWWAIR
jgi:hypothetical protein